MELVCRLRRSVLSKQHWHLGRSWSWSFSYCLTDGLLIVSPLALGRSVAMKLVCSYIIYKLICEKNTKQSVNDMVHTSSTSHVVWPTCIRGGRTWRHVVARIWTLWLHSKGKNRECKLQGWLYGQSHDGRSVFSTMLSCLASQNWL